MQTDSFDPEEGRDYTYSVDTARGLMAVLDAPELPHDLYNLTAGPWITYREILATLAEACARQPGPGSRRRGGSGQGAGVCAVAGAALGTPP